jgi:hypothetical protein
MSGPITDLTDSRNPVRRTAAICCLLFPLLACLTSCETLRHQFVQPSSTWQARVGQLQYRGPRITLIGDVLVRFSQSGDFELTFSKGPGVTLMLIRQDANFARVEGPLSHGHWSGPIDKAPRRLQGWLALRNALMRSQQPILKQSVGRETFLFAF